MSRSLLRDTVELRLSLADDLWSIEANPDDVQTAIVTLSAHVRDALPQGGTITLEAADAAGREALASGPGRGRAILFSSTIRSAGPDESGRRLSVELEPSFVLRDLDLSSWLSLRQSLHFLQGLGGASEVRRDGTGTAIVLYLPRADAATLLPAGAVSEDDPAEERRPAHGTWGWWTTSPKWRAGLHRRLRNWLRDQHRDRCRTAGREA